MRLCPPARHVHGGDELCSSACASTKQKEPVEAGEVKFEDVSVNECRGVGTASFWNTSFGTRCVHSLVPVFCWHFSFVFPCGLSVVFCFCSLSTVLLIFVFFLIFSCSGCLFLSRDLGGFSRLFLFLSPGFCFWVAFLSPGFLLGGFSFGVFPFLFCDVFFSNLFLLCVISALGVAGNFLDFMQGAVARS